MKSVIIFLVGIFSLGINVSLYAVEANNVPWSLEYTKGGSAVVPIGEQSFIAIWISKPKIYFTLQDASTHTKTGCSILEFKVTEFNQRWGGDCIPWETFNGSRYGSAVSMTINQEALSQLMYGNNMVVWLDNQKWDVTLRGSSRAIRELLGLETLLGLD